MNPNQKHIDFRDHAVRPHEENVYHRTMNNLFRADEPHQVITNFEVFQYVTRGQVASLNIKGKHLFYRHPDGALQKADVEDGQVVLRILHLDEIDYVEENGL